MDWLDDILSFFCDLLPTGRTGCFVYLFILALFLVIIVIFFR